MWLSLPEIFAPLGAACPAMALKGNIMGASQTRSTTRYSFFINVVTVAIPPIKTICPKANAWGHLDRHILKRIVCINKFEQENGVLKGRPGLHGFGPHLVQVTLFRSKRGLSIKIFLVKN